MFVYLHRCEKETEEWLQVLIARAQKGEKGEDKLFILNANVQDASKIKIQLEQLKKKKSILNVEIMNGK